MRLHARAQGRVEDVVGGHDVGAERHLLGHQVGRRDRGKMHDRIGRAELAERVVLAARSTASRPSPGAKSVRSTLQERADRIGRGGHVDVQHLVAAFDKMRGRPPAPPCRCRR